MVADGEDASFHFIELVYVNEEGIVEINKKHLGRDYVTDIITFRYDEGETYSEVEGTLFCCAPRIKEQALEFKESEFSEFCRILIHGLLHLLDYNDQSDEEKKKMRALENHYLDKYKTVHAK